MFEGFEPFFDEHSKILILGSFPSVKSRENGFYYGNPQNRFWKMLSDIFEEEMPTGIASKKEFLKKHKIALYDVVTQSDLQGSADATLEKSFHSLANLSSLLPPHTKIKKILCNGKTSFNLLTKKTDNFCFENDEIFLINQNLDTKNGQKCGKNAKIPVFCMSSTSSANPRFDIKEWHKQICDEK